MALNWLLQYCVEDRSNTRTKHILILIKYIILSLYVIFFLPSRYIPVYRSVAWYAEMEHSVVTHFITRASLNFCDILCIVVKLNVNLCCIISVKRFNNLFSLSGKRTHNCRILEAVLAQGHNRVTVNAMVVGSISAQTNEIFNIINYSL